VKTNAAVVQQLQYKITQYWNKTCQYHAKKTEEAIIALLHDGTITTESSYEDIEAVTSILKTNEELMLIYVLTKLSP